MFVSPAFAQTAAAPGGAASAITQFVPLILIFVIMYFLMIRPQQKKMAAHRAMVDALKKGDTIVTQGGIVAKVMSVGDAELEVEIAQGVRVKVVRATVAQVVTATTPVAANA